MLRRSGGNARLVDGIGSPLDNGDRVAGVALGLDPAPELVQTFWAHAGGGAELVVARGDWLAHDALTKPNGVLGTIHHDIRRGLANRVLCQGGFELHEAILDGPISTKNFGDILCNSAGKRTTRGGALADHLFGPVKCGCLEIDTVEPVRNLEAIAKADREGRALLNLVALVGDLNVQGRVHGEAVSVVAVHRRAGDLDATSGRRGPLLRGDDRVAAVGGNGGRVVGGVFGGGERRRNRGRDNAHGGEGEERDGLREARALRELSGGQDVSFCVDVGEHVRPRSVLSWKAYTCAECFSSAFTGFCWRIRLRGPQKWLFCN